MQHEVLAPVSILARWRRHALRELQEVRPDLGVRMIACRYLWVNWWYRKHRHIWQLVGPMDSEYHRLHVYMTCARREWVDLVGFER